MLCLQLIKDAEDEDAYHASFGSDVTCLKHKTQVALYLLQPCAGGYLPRVVCASSYFSFVSTLDALNENGLKHT